MKTIKLFILAMFIFAGFNAVSAQTIEVKPDYFDAYVDQAGKVEPALDMLLISNIAPPAYNLNSAVMNFKMPAIPAGTSLLSASFTATVLRKDQWVSFNGDLYGIDFRAADVATAGDYFSGAFVAGSNVGNGSDWGIMDNFLDNASITFGNPLTNTKTTDASANEQLKNFLLQQYGNGATNKYAFLRLSMDNIKPATNWQRFSIASSADVTYYPRLTLVFGITNKIDETPNNLTKLRITSDSKIDIEIDEPLIDAQINVYTTIGKNILSENLKSENYQSSISLKSGAYIIKLLNHGKLTTRSIIVK